MEKNYQKFISFLGTKARALGTHAFEMQKANYDRKRKNKQPSKQWENRKRYRLSFDSSTNSRKENRGGKAKEWTVKDMKSPDEVTEQNWDRPKEFFVVCSKWLNGK